MTPHTRPETTPAPDVVVPTSDLTPAEAWEVLVEGNRRFVAGASRATRTRTPSAAAG